MRHGVEYRIKLYAVFNQNVIRLSAETEDASKRILNVKADVEFGQQLPAAGLEVLATAALDDHDPVTSGAVGRFDDKLLVLTDNFSESADLD